MSEEEKKAIEYLKYLNKNLDFNKTGFVYGNEYLELALNLIEKQDKIIDLMAGNLIGIGRYDDLEGEGFPKICKNKKQVKEYFKRRVEKNINKKM